MNTIQAMVAPAVMLSVCGLLLLSITPKLGRVVDRLRSFAAELRALDALPALTPPQQARRASIGDQLVLLHRRATMLQRTCAILFFAVLAFVLTSVAVGLAGPLGPVGTVVALVSFVAGLVLILAAVALAYFELRLARRTMLRESSDHAD